ncbi:MAG: hypothetical protein LC126_12440 [Bryobacterales bacterium]|nr:hypothetical protein [Bryobacterales bacterium]
MRYTLTLFALLFASVTFASAATTRQNCGNSFVRAAEATGHGLHVAAVDTGKSAAWAGRQAARGVGWPVAELGKGVVSAGHAIARL